MSKKKYLCFIIISALIVVTLSILSTKKSEIFWQINIFQSLTLLLAIFFGALFNFSVNKQSQIRGLYINSINTLISKINSDLRINFDNFSKDKLLSAATFFENKFNHLSKYKEAKKCKILINNITKEWSRYNTIVLDNINDFEHIKSKNINFNQALDVIEDNLDQMIIAFWENS